LYIYKYISDISNDFNLNQKMKRFGNSTIKICVFNNINLLYLEPHTCEAIYFNNTYYTDAEAEKKFNTCNVINEPINHNKHNKFIPFIIPACIIIIFMVYLLLCQLKKINQKKNNQINFISKNEYGYKGITIVYNINQNSNDSNNNNSGNNNNNNDNIDINENNNSNNSQNNINRNYDNSVTNNMQLNNNDNQNNQHGSDMQKSQLGRVTER